MTEREQNVSAVYKIWQMNWKNVCQHMLEQGLLTSIGCCQIILKFQALKRISILFKI